MATSNSNPNPNPMKRDREKFEARPALRDRFDAKVEEMKQRGPVGTPEIARLYGDFLLELTRNSKPLIVELTAIAAKYKDHVEGIANAILDRIVEVPVERKLPSWYLLDSILKNVGDQYRLYFAGRLDTIFIDTYKTLSPTLRPAMVHLFRTWGKYIPSFARDSIENFLKKDHTPASSGDLRHSGSHSPHLSRGHVNAKYLVAFHRMEHSAADAKQSRLPPSLLSYGQKSSDRDGEYDHDDHDLLPPHPGFEKVGTSAIAGVNDVLSLPRPSSHPRIGSKLNSFSETVADRPSSLCGFGYERPSNCNVELTRGWSDGEQNTEASWAYNRKNECDKLHSRLLNDSYGNKDALHEKVTKFQKLDFSGRSSDMPIKESRSSEEEFVWEKMCPTFPRKEYNSTLFGHNTDLPRSNAPYLGNDLGSNRHNQSADIIADSGCRASGDKFQDYVVSHEESMLRSQNSYHCQETLKLSNEPQERSTPFVATPVSPRLVPRNSCYVQAQGAVFSPNSSALPTEIIPTNPPPQSSLHTFRPIYLPSLHPSPFSLPSAAAAPHPFPAAADAASISPVATAPLTPHPAAPTPHPAPHNFACPSPPPPPPPPPPPRFNPAYPLPILPPPVAPSYNSLSFTYLPSGWLPLPLSGPLPASSQTPPVPHGTNTGISESPASAFQGLLSSLLAQGFLSCPSNLSQDTLIDFNPGLLKVRHESSINAMYDNLSKQCRTCGMRFISQEDLIGHMDWHMTVDRVARNQNPKSSCNWYVNAKEWLSGVEALGNDVLPGNFFHMSQ